MTGEKVTQATLDDVIFHAQRSAIYDRNREGFLRGMATLAMVAGWAALTAIWCALPEHHWYDFPIFVMFMFFVVDESRKLRRRADEHAKSASSYHLLSASCMGVDESKRPEDPRACLEIFHAGCGPTYKVIDALAHNQMCFAGNHDQGYLLVPLRYRLLRHFLRFDGTTFPIVSRAEWEAGRRGES